MRDLTTAFASNGKKEKLIDEAMEETFPNSDPPAWTLGRDSFIDFHRHHQIDVLSQLLIEDHLVVRKVMQVFSQLIAAIEEGKAIPLHDLHQLILLYREFIDEFHERKETILLPVLRGDALSDYLIADLKNEYVLGSHLLDNLDDVVRHTKVDNNSNKEKIISLLKEIKNVHVNHNAKEESYVLPLVSKLLTDSEQKKLLIRLKNGREDRYVELCEKILTLSNRLMAN